MATETAAVCECTHEPPHRFAYADRSRVPGGILLTLRRLDERYPPRDLFVTNREMKMAGDFVYKGCFVCVDRGFRETAIALNKSDIDLGLPPGV